MQHAGNAVILHFKPCIYFALYMFLFSIAGTIAAGL